MAILTTYHLTAKCILVGDRKNADPHEFRTFFRENTKKFLTFCLGMSGYITVHVETIWTGMSMPQ